MPWLAESLTWDAAPALMLIGFAYLLCDLEARRVEGRARGADRMKHLLLWAVAAIYLVLPTLRLIVLRHGSAPHTYVHDNILQQEEALKFLFAGKDPYAVDYLSTPMAAWEPNNPALYHYMHLPVQLLIGLPLERFCRATLGWFDLRMVYLLLLMAMLALTVRIGRTRSHGLALFAVVALNPLFSRCFVEGRNDIVVQCALFAALAAHQAGRPRLVGVLLGAAAASKHTVWVLTPFLLVLLWRRPDGGRRTPRELLTLAAPGLITAAILFGPFVLWDPVAFVRSILGFPFGANEHSYPLRGPGAYGLADWVLTWGLVPNDAAPFPFWIFQLALGAPCLLYALRWLRREPSVRTLAIGYALTLFALQFSSRFFNQNHLGFILTVLGVGVFGSVERLERASVVAPLPARADAA
jgi:hypothetical protein